MRDKEITSIEKLKEKVETIEKSLGSKKGYAIVYRAFSNKNKKKDIDEEKPSLFYDNELIDNENEIYHDFIAAKPNEFENMTTFDTLTKMRHYEVPNRLLDVTFDPLLALFFSIGRDKKNISSDEIKEILNTKAKDENKIKNIRKLLKKFEGSNTICVYVVKKENIKNYDSDTVTVLSILTKLKKDQKKMLKKIVDWFKYKKEVKEVSFDDCKKLIAEIKKTDRKANEEKKIKIDDKISEWLKNKSKKHDEKNYKSLFTVTELFNFFVSTCVSELNWQLKREIPSWYEDVLNLDTFTQCYLVKPKMNNPRIIAQSGAFFIYPFEDTDIKESLLKTDAKKIVFKIKKEIKKELNVLNIRETKYMPDDLAKYAKEIKEADKYKGKKSV